MIPIVDVAENATDPLNPIARASRFDLLARRGLWITLALAAFAQLLHWVQIRSADPFYGQTFPPMDMDLYWRWGKAIAAGDWIGAEFTRGEPFYFSPLCPYYLGVLFRLFGAEFDGVHFANALINLLPPLLVWGMARRLFGNGQALAAGVLTAFCSPLLFYGQLLLSDGLLPAIYAGLLYCLVRGQESPSRRGLWAFAAGALTAMACWGRGNAFALIPLIGAVFLFLPRIWRAPNDEEAEPAIRPRDTRPPEKSAPTPTTKDDTNNRPGPRRLGIGAAALYFLGAALLIAPPLARNLYVSGQWVLVANNGPYNLYVGNVSDSVGVLNEPPSSRILIKRYGDIESVPWTRELMADIVSHPGRFALHLFEKTILFWNGYEAADNASYYAAKSFTTLLRWSPVVWWTLVPLGFLGAWRARKRWRDQLFLYVYEATYFLSILVVFVSGRFRLGALIPLLVWAGVEAAGIARDIQEHAWRRVGIAAAGLLLGMAALWPGWSPARLRNAPQAAPWNSPVIRATDYHNLATAHFRLGERDAARAWLEQGVRDYPAHGALLARLVTADVEEGRLEPAAQNLDAYLRRSPDDVVALLQLSDIEVRSGRPEKARIHLRRILTVDPQNRPAREMLDRMAKSTGQDNFARPETR